MTNTIPNVPRELKPCPFCGSEAGRATKKATWNLSRHRVACTNSGCGAHYGYWHPNEWNNRALLSAPSPAGVDGLEVVGCLLVKGNQLSRMPAGTADEPLCRLSAAKAIIDGLRGENERIRLNIAEYNEAIACYQSERDQQAHRIGELEGLLRACHTGLYPFDNRVLEREICTALSAGKKGE